MAALTKPARIVSGSLLRLQNDVRLAELARDGHEPAFETLVQRYRPELVRASIRIVGPDRAEDAVQQALLNAHRAIDTTENVQNLRAWLHKITQNSSLNILRSVRDELPLDAQPNVATALAGPADTAQLSERLRDTLAAIDALPENQRAAILLRELEGRSHEDIATALGVTTGAARQQLMRARQGVRSAVTVLTPYPLIAGLTSPGTSAGLAELIFGAGASATALKLGAGVAATGAIAGGLLGATSGVQTRHVSAAPTHKTTSTQTTSRPLTPPAAKTGATRTTDDNGGGTDKSGSDDNSGPSSRGDTRGKRDNTGRGGSDGARRSRSGSGSGAPATGGVRNPDSGSGSSVPDDGLSSRTGGSSPDSGSGGSGGGSRNDGLSRND
jgi:RNA polymerase sigma factor (sigma-70 family)